MLKKQKHNNKIINTLISEHCSIKGDIHTQQSIQIEGYFEGEINSQGEVFITESSKINGNIFGKQVHVAGEVIGNIEAISGLIITKTGKVYGDITGDHLLIEEGAIYRGKVNMDVISSKTVVESQLQFITQS